MDGVLKLTPIVSERLHEVWPQILPGLERVREHTDGYWLPEDVYHAIRAGSSTLHLGYIDDAYVGFLVLTLIQHFDGRVIHVWCAYSNGECDDIVMRTLPELEAHARKENAKRLTMWSERRWDRKLKPFGFEPTHTEYVKEL